MIEYITKEQAIHAMEQVTQPKCFIEDTRKDFAKIIEKLPAADVVEVVRCEDCKHRVVDEIILSLTSVPETAWVCDIGTTACLTGFYCGRGERKDGQQ